MNTPQYEKLSYLRLNMLFGEQRVGDYFTYHDAVRFEEDGLRYEIAPFYSERMGDDLIEHLVITKLPASHREDMSGNERKRLEQEAEYLEVSVNAAMEMVNPMYYHSVDEEIEAYDKLGNKSPDYDDLLAYTYNVLQSFIDYQNRSGVILAPTITSDQVPRLSQLGAVYR